MKNGIYTTATLLLAGCLHLLAAPGAQADEPLELEPIQVRTASRSVEDLGDAMASMSVITAEDIRTSAAQDLVDLLKLEAGLDVVRTGGPGQQTSLFLRGSNSNHTLVLIDGIRVSSAHTGAYAWEHLPLNQVERVEIVRGPRGSMYGLDAIGGVIQIFPRPVDAPFLHATAGAYGSRELETGAGGVLADARFSISAGYRDSDGYSAQNTNGFSYDPDKDGFNSRNANVSGAGEAGSVKWQFRITGINDEAEFDQGLSRSEQRLASTSLSGDWRKGWHYRLYAGRHDDTLTSDFGFFTSKFDSTRLDLGWENHVQLPSGSLDVGLDHYDERGESAGSYSRDRNNTGWFIAWKQQAGPALLHLSGRLDDNSLFGAELTHQAAVQFPLGEAAELTLSQGTAFRAPNLSEQFSPGFGGLFAGNPALEPESSDSNELIYRLETRKGSQVSVAVYRTRVEGLIAFTGPEFQAININRADLDGLEVAFDRHWGAWRMRASATLQDTEDRSTGQPLLRRPDKKASLRLSRQFAQGSWLSAEWFASGSQSDVGGVTLPGYALWNLTAAYQFSPEFRFEARVDNVLDREYEPARGFNASGRAAYLSIHWAK